MAKTGPAPMVDFRDFIPRSDQERYQLIRALVDIAGVGPGQAWTILEVLERIERTGEDGLGSTNAAYVRRSQLRRALSQLGGAPWRGGRPIGDKGAYLSSANMRRQARRRRNPRTSWRPRFLSSAA